MKKMSFAGELLLLSGLSLLVLGATALIDLHFLPWSALFCLLFLGLGLFLALCRRKQLQEVSRDLDSLIRHETPLPLNRYAEGELGILSCQIQKVALRLTDTAARLRGERQFLADSMADLSHQLRTPLTAMHLTVSLLSEPELPRQRRLELTRELYTLLSGMEWLIEALLKLSRLDAGQTEMVPEELPLRLLLERAAGPLAIPMELREQKLEITCPRELTLRTDPAWTGEALGNLLKNAVEHTPRGGRILVSASRTALYTEIVLEDTGPGFAREDLPRLFERFYKGKGASGYGIGLSLARKIITAQEGTIQAMNGKNGARFVVRFYDRAPR